MMTTKIGLLAVTVLCLGALALSGCGGGGRFEEDTEHGAFERITVSKDPADIQNAVDLCLEKYRNDRFLAVMKSRAAKETDPAIKDMLQKVIDELEPELQRKREEAFSETQTM
jgi:hypothetical protein